MNSIPQVIEQLIDLEHNFMVDFYVSSEKIAKILVFLPSLKQPQTHQRNNSIDLCISLARKILKELENHPTHLQDELVEKTKFRQQILTLLRVLKEEVLKLQ